MAQITEALSQALKNGDVDAVKNWLNNGGDVEEQFIGRTPLLLCTFERGHVHADVIRLLLDQGANINVQDSRGRSPLHWVVSHCDESSSHLEIIRCLLDRGANMNLQDKDGKTPLYLAIENRSNVTARLLMDNGANVNLQNKIGWAPLHCVVGKIDKTPNDLEVIRFLVDRGADLDLQDNNGNTPLYLALWRRSNTSANLLMDSGANVNVRNKIGCSLLHCVVGHDDTSPSNIQMIKLLLGAGADINLQNEMGKTPLYLAVQNKNIIISKLLLGMSANANVQDKMGWSPLHYVMGNYEIFSNNVTFVKSLLDAGADINLQDNNGKTAPDLALEKYITAPEITFLLGGGATPDLREKYGSFPLHYIVNNSNWNDFNVSAAVAKSMIERGVDVNGQDDDGNTPLHLALMNKNNAVVALLLDRGASIDMENNSGFSPLQCILNHCDESVCYVDLIKALIDKGVNVNMQDNDGNSPIHLALMKKNSYVVRLFLDSGASVNIQNNSGRSPLHYVLNHCLQFSSYVEDIKCLIDKDADVNMVDHDGNTPLHLLLKSIRKSLPPSLGLLNSPAEQSPTYRQSRSVMLDMQIKINNIIALLLDNGANVNIPNNDGVSLLHCAVVIHCTYRLDITRRIISQTIDVNVQDNRGQTPLHQCTGPDYINPECLSILLDWGGSLRVEDNDGKKPLYYLSQKKDQTSLLNEILINKCLTQYVQRVKWTGLVHDIPEVPDANVDDNDSYQSRLINELERMKQDKVGGITLHHVFDRYQDPFYVDNSDFSAVVNENYYLLYGELLKATFAKATRRKAILDRAVSCFNIPIPVETRRMILSSLDSSDILSLVFALNSRNIEGNL